MALVAAPLFLWLAANPGAEYRVIEEAQPLAALMRGDLEPVARNGLKLLAFFVWRGDPLIRQTSLAGLSLICSALSSLSWVSLSCSGDGGDQSTPLPSLAGYIFNTKPCHGRCTQFDSKYKRARYRGRANWPSRKGDCASHEAAPTGHLVCSVLAFAGNRIHGASGKKLGARQRGTVCLADRLNG